MIGLMFTWILLHGIANGIIVKNNSNSFARKGSAGYFLYSSLSSVSGVIFFFCVNGFEIECNRYTMLYSVLYASIILLNYLIGLLIYKFQTVAIVSVTTTAGRIPVNFLFGVLLFDEKVTFFKICSLILMVAATCLATTRNKSQYTKRGVTTPFVLLLLLTIMLSVASNITVKYYGLDTRVCNQNALFFMTNLIMFLFALAGFIYHYGTDKDEVIETCQDLHTKDYAFVVLQTVGSNISSIVNALLIAQIDLSVFTVVSSAFALLGAVGASVCLKEKNDMRLYISVIMAIIAIVFGVL